MLTNKQILERANELWVISDNSTDIMCQRVLTLCREMYNLGSNGEVIHTEYKEKSNA